MVADVIIVSFNTVEHLRRCLSSVVSQPGVGEVVVVDNASEDGSPEMVASEFPNVTLIKNVTNVGFGRANNQGIAATISPIVLLLNSDIEAEDGAIQRMLETLDQENAVAIGGALVDAGGVIQPSCCTQLTLWAVFCEQTGLEKLFPSSSIWSPYWITNRLPKDMPSDVAQVMGACLMMRRGELFDERYFLYCEDTELCIRLARMGKILYEPRARFKHALGASTSLERRWWSIALYNRGKELTFLIHRSRWAAMVCWVLNRKGAAIRLLLAVLSFNRSRIRTFWRVMTAPISGPRV